MREPLINDEEPRGAGDAFIESMTPRSHWERDYRVDATRYYIDGRVYIFGRARLYLGASRDKRDIYCVVPRQNIDVYPRRTR